MQSSNSLSVLEGSTKWKPGRPFYFGLALTLLATWIPFVPAWYTFIHMWRVDLAASLFLFVTLSYLFLRSRDIAFVPTLSKQERWLIVFPMMTFIMWSALSITWAPSWKSGVHHTLIWAEYLIFYLLARYLVDEGDNAGKLVRTLAIVLVLFAIPAIVESIATMLIGGDTSFRARFAKYGEQMLTVLPIIWVVLLRASGRKFKAALAACAAMWLLIYCTAGRINIFLFTLLVVAIGIAVVALPKFHRYRRRFAAVILIFIVTPVPFYFLSLAAGASDPIVARFADSAGNAYSNGFRELMNGVSIEMLKTNPLNGVGADNYGFQYNNYREWYAAKYPNDVNLAYGEVGIVGQAHNEFLQIAAELGLIGSAIFAWFLCGLAYLGWLSLLRLRQGSFFPFAATMGLAMFLTSSAVSSYSFRLIQNGFVFFIVLAIASKMLLRPAAEAGGQMEHRVWLRPSLAGAISACLLLATYSSIRVASVIVTAEANRTGEIDDAAPLYRTAMQLDDENPDVRNNLAARLFHDERYAEAIPLLADSIRIGRAESTDFSYLATCQSLTGDSIAAENTMKQAAALYPRSPFVLTRYAGILQYNKKADEAAIYLDRALDLDRPAANTWWTMINRGSQVASDMAFSRKDHLPIMDLQPTASIYAVLDERQILHPEEKSISKP